MTRPLSSVLLVEGPSDDLFFPGLVDRVLRDIGFSDRAADFDVTEPIVLMRRGDRPFNTFAEEVGRMSPLPSLTFLHFDAGASPDREGSRAWVPMEKAWQTNDDLLKQTRLVKLAPVREMESWALADLDKVNQLAGCDVRRPDVFESDLLGDVERLTKPKRTLTEALRADSGRRRSRRKASECLPLLAERVRLDRLDRVPSFARWRADTVAALRELSFIR